MCCYFSARPVFCLFLPLFSPRAVWKLFLSGSGATMGLGFSPLYVYVGIGFLHFFFYSCLDSTLHPCRSLLLRYANAKTRKLVIISLFTLACCQIHASKARHFTEELEFFGKYLLLIFCLIAYQRRKRDNHLYLE